ncbi:MAG: hypothetical protein AAF543_05805 [Pseudomonadota bacterium]
MTSHSLPGSAALTSDILDQLFSDCAELEARIVAIRQAIEKLEPAVDAGLVTADHLMNLAFRVENAEHGLIAIAHQVSDTATTMIQRRKVVDAARWQQATEILSALPETTRN